MTVATNEREALSRTRLHAPLTATSDSLVGLACLVLQDGKAKNADVNARVSSFRTIMRPIQAVMEAPAKLIVEIAMVIDFSSQCEWKLRVQRTITTMLLRSGIHQVTCRDQQQG